MRRWTGYLVAACAVSVFAISSLAQGTATLNGTVSGADGQPKSFARVQLQGNAIYAAVTDVSGKFKIANVTAGTYRVTIRQNDNAETQTVQVSGSTLALVAHW